MSLLLKDDDARQLYIMYGKITTTTFSSLFLSLCVCLSLSLSSTVMYISTHTYIYYTITQKHDLLIVSQHKDECVCLHHSWILLESRR